MTMNQVERVTKTVAKELAAQPPVEGSTFRRDAQSKAGRAIDAFEVARLRYRQTEANPTCTVTKSNAALASMSRAYDRATAAILKAVEVNGRDRRKGRVERSQSGAILHNDRMWFVVPCENVYAMPDGFAGRLTIGSIPMGSVSIDN